jgi:hypothetical protein
MSLLPAKRWRARRDRHRRRTRRNRRTAALAAVATGTTLAVVLAEFAHVWRRGSAPNPTEADDVLEAGVVAAQETVQVAREGYRTGSPLENALLNMLLSFAISFLLARGTAWRLRTRKTVGPFRDLKVGQTHIHHFVPGIVLAFVSGAAAVIVRDPALDKWVAIPFGCGVALTLDESALLLQLDDVYWTEEGILGVQITLTVLALLASTALVLRVLRRGEQEVLENADGPSTDFSDLAALARSGG